MQAPSHIPYQAYRPKRHSRNISGSNQAQHITPSVSPPPAARPSVAYMNGNTNGHSHSHNLSEPVVPLQRDFESEKEDKESFLQAALPAANAFGAKMVRMIDQTRRTVSLTDVMPPFEPKRVTPPPAASPPLIPPQPAATVPSIVLPHNEDTSKTPSPPAAEQDTSPPSSVSTQSSLPPMPTTDTHARRTPTEPNNSDPVSGPSSLGSTPQTSPGASPRPTLSSLSSSRKSSTFRHVPIRVPSARPALPSSPLRPQSVHARTASGLTVSARQLGAGSASSRVPEPPSRLTSPQVGPTNLSAGRGAPSPVPTLELPSSVHPRSSTPQSLASAGSALAQNQHNNVDPPPRTSSFNAPVQPTPRRITPASSTSSNPAIPSVSPVSPSPSQSSSVTQRAATPSRSSAPYRPGFQPRGVYRPRTDEFLEARRTRSDVGRVERTRLERRLEKLIHLHFPHPDKVKEKEAQTVSPRPAAAQNRRASSFFDIDMSSLRGKSASELWRGVVQSQAASAKNDIRAAEQIITPWEDDAAVSQCPLCSSSFHPLTNRKHHCRLCGRIICSLPVKYPQRPQQCSLLFVADPITGQIEEVDQGVDYGVRRRTRSTNQSMKGKERDDAVIFGDDDKFLRGVRICGDCKPVLLRRQYIQEVHKVPLFVRLYEAFIALEKEIEDALPQFQELMLSLSHEERPSPEASAARKRLLEAFAQYDAVAKRIRKLPCSGGPGSSQDRVQQAILNRANTFLQKNMFPLQALPKVKKNQSVSPAPAQQDTVGPVIDPDSEVARILQPLLEQEALLESFVEEAKAHRKLEDVQTLKANLAEIRMEIDRILANADGSSSETRPTR